MTNQFNRPILTNEIIPNSPNNCINSLLFRFLANITYDFEFKDTSIFFVFQILTAAMLVLLIGIISGCKDVMADLYVCCPFVIYEQQWGEKTVNHNYVYIKLMLHVEGHLQTV